MDHTVHDINRRIEKTNERHYPHATCSFSPQNLPKTPNTLSPKGKTPFLLSSGSPLHHAILLLIIRPERHRQHGPQLERGKGNQTREAKERNDDHRDYVTVRFVINGAFICFAEAGRRKEGGGGQNLNGKTDRRSVVDSNSRIGRRREGAGIGYIPGPVLEGRSFNLLRLHRTGRGYISRTNEQAGGFLSQRTRVSRTGPYLSRRTHNLPRGLQISGWRKGKKIPRPAK